MSSSESFGIKAIGRRGTLLLAALALSVGMFLAIATGPVAKAHAGAEYFCYHYAAPYGWAGDRCYSGSRWLTWVRAYGYNASACSNAYQGGLVTSWACAPQHTWSNSYFDGSRFMQGVVRNNNLNGNNQIWGYEEYL